MRHPKGPQLYLRKAKAKRRSSDVGSSLTETQTDAAARSAQAHLNAIAQRLRKSTPITSPEKHAPKFGRVIQLKS